MKQKIYIETTIPSFYFEIRNDPEMIAMREWTKNCWNNQRHHYELVTSIPVIEELEKGDHPSKKAALGKGERGQVCC